MRDDTDSIKLKQFGGVVSSRDSKDIPDYAAEYDTDVDGSAPYGVLKGIKGNTSVSPTVANATYADWLTYISSGVQKYDLIYLDKNAGDLTRVQDFYGSPSLADLNTGMSNATCLKTFGNIVEIGRGQGNDPHCVVRLLNTRPMFASSESFAAGLHDDYGHCRNYGTAPGGISVTAIAYVTGSAPQYFEADRMYGWKTSIVFDGIEESPPIGIYSKCTYASASATITITADSCDTASNCNPRWTAVKLYRAESPDDNQANLGAYRLVDTIDINDGSWSGSGDFTISITDTGTLESNNTYEEETGMPSELLYTYIEYSHNAVGNDYHFVTNGEVPNTPVSIDWTKYLFRSKRHRPNMFDWTNENDFLVLPENAKAMTFYEGKLYVFSSGTMYRIDPELMYIEDTFEGAGCTWTRAVTVTEFGMFFCNEKGAWQYDGRELKAISDTLGNNSSDARYWGLLDNYAITGHIVLYHAPTRYVLFIGDENASGAKSRAWAYHLPTGRWDWLTFGSLTVTAYSGAFNGRDGEVYFSYSNFVSLMTNATRLGWSWCSKEFDCEQPEQDKRFLKVRFTKTGTVTCKYASEGTDPSGGTTTTDGTMITAANRKKKTIQLYFSASSGANTVEDAEIVFRRMQGHR